jgi:tetratricopeptide (TPR) repeat protein
MGIIYNALGASDKALHLYRKVISMDPNNAGAYFNLGYLNESAGELREALNNYEKAVENDPRHAEAYYNMGNVYATLEQYPEAIASYLKTVSINPNHENVYVNLSILSFKAKDFQGAIRYLEEARLLGYNPPAAYLKTLEPYRKK